MRLSLPFPASFCRLAGRTLALTVAFSACGGHEPHRPPASLPTAPGNAATAETQAPMQLDADTPMKSASGASFEAPKGWFVTKTGERIVLQTPERDLVLTLLELPNEPDAERAIASAWKKVAPDFKRTPKATTTPPTKDGWDAITQIVYETGGSEARAVLALARRKAGTQYVLLLDGAAAGLDRRGAQLATIISTFKAPGVEEESLEGRTANTMDASRLRLLETFLRDAMSRAQVPGAAIAIVAGNKVVFEKGFGVRELGKKAPISPKTLFMIGSTTKSLTTLMMAKLVDEGKFGWDTPASQILPSFALGDADVTRKVLMRHTVCACTGLPRQDLEFLFEYANATPEDRIASMKSMKPTTGFGETFQYSNTMVAAGGYIAAHALAADKKLGPAYDDAMQLRVFGPLGMASTTVDFSRAQAREHASPHAENLKLETTAFPVRGEEAVVAIRPAGAAWSTVGDMARYLMLELSKGRDPKGKVIVSETNLLKRREPQIKITDKESYGLGLFVENDHGIALVHHGGNNLGFTSDLYFMPEHGVGVVLLTNAGDANAFRDSVRRRVIELLFDAKEEAATALEFRLKRRRDSYAKELANVALEPELAWSKSLVGDYTNASLGRLSLRMDGKVGILDAGEWKSAFGKQTEADGSVKLILLDAPMAGFTFAIREQAGRTTLSVEAPQHAYVFEPATPSQGAAAK